MEKVFISNSMLDTQNIANQILSYLTVGDTLILSGDLGAGKTTFTKCLAHSLNIKEDVTSPTFTLVQEYYSGNYPLYHFDMYRIEDEDEAKEIGVLDYFYARNKQKGLCVVEWAENTPNLVPKNSKKLIIKKIGETSREFTLLID